MSVASTGRASKLDDFRRRELDAVNALNRLRVISEKVKLDDAMLAQIDLQLARNRERRFSLAIVGEFKRGKSTVINALLGKEILPSDVSPCSATINRVVYGMPPAVRLLYRGEGDRDGAIEEIEIDQLANYVTKLTPEAEKRAAQIKEATVFYPVEYCRDNVEIIDTPGLNDDVAMTTVTVSVLHEVSAAIMVIMATSPFSQYEADFLANQLMLEDLGRVMFVVTGIDLIRKQQDRKRVKETIEQRIASAVEERLAAKFGKDTPQYLLYRQQIGEPEAFPVSGLLALEAKQSGDAELEAESGFPAFEDALEKFITETRGAVELQVLNNRIVASGNEILSRLAVEVGAMRMQQEDFDRAYTTGIAELDRLREQRTDEARLIDTAAHRTKQAVRPIVLRLEEVMKQAAAAVIEETVVTVNDVKSAPFAEKFGKRISAAVQNAAKRVAEDIQLTIEQHLIKEVERLGGFAAQVNQSLTNIEMQFVKAGSSEQSSRGRMVMAGIVGGLGSGIAGSAIAGYDVAGVKGAVVSSAIGVGALFASGMALGLLSIPVTLPALIVVGVVSTLSSGALTKIIFRERAIQQFKDEYREHVFDEIKRQFQTQRFDHQSDEQIDQIFTALREKVIGEAEAVIEQQRSTLDQVRANKAAHETLGNHMARESEALTAEVTALVNHAQAESQRIAQLINETITPKDAA